MTIGEKIRKIREDAKLNQEQFAEKLNVTRQSVSKWESNKNFPETNKLISLCSHFNVSIEYLLDENKTIVDNHADTYTYDQIVYLHKKINKHKRKNVLRFVGRIAIVLLVIQIFQMLFNVLSSGNLTPQEINPIYLDWDTDSLLRGLVPNLALLPIMIIVVIWFYDKYNDVLRNTDLKHLAADTNETVSVDKKYKKKTVHLIIFINLAFLFGLLYKVTSVKVMFSFIDAIEAPKYGRDTTNSPTIGTMFNQIFSINFISIFLYASVVVLITYVLLKEIYKKKLFYYFVALIGILVLLLLINNLFLGVLLLILIIANTLLSLLIIRYYTHKPLLKIAIFYTVFITITTLFSSYIEYQSFGGFIESPITIFGIVIFEDFVVTQSAANAYLVSIILDGLIGIELLVVSGFIIYFIANLYNKWRKNNRQLKFLNATFFVFTGTIIVSLIGSFIAFLISFTMFTTMNYDINNNNPYTTTILSNQCYSDEYLSREMGANIIKDNKVFIKCFDTTEGVYSVYYTVESYAKGSLFDLYYEEVIYDEVIVLNDEGNTVLRLDYTNSALQIQITTKKEVDEGYMNLISHRYMTKDIDMTEANLEDYNVTIYDINGTMLREFEGVVVHVAQTKTDPLHLDGHKYLFLDNEVYYIDVLEEDNPTYKYSFTEGVVTPLSSDEWREYNQSH